MRRKQPIDITAHVQAIKDFRGDVVDGFFDEYSFLSNFHRVPCVVRGVTFKTSEHAYQALKLDDPKLVKLVADEPTPFACKKKLHEIVDAGLAEHPDLETLKRIMDICIAGKFREGTVMAEMLVRTDPKLLVEGNWWKDQRYGVCQGKGMNLLGKALMRRRLVLTQRTLYSWENDYLFGPDAMLPGD